MSAHYERALKMPVSMEIAQHRIVIAHHLTHKGNTLARIVHSLGPSERAIYLADEFTESGNDAAVLTRGDRLGAHDFSLQ